MGPARLPDRKAPHRHDVDAVKGRPDTYALHVHCQTTLIADFQTHYPDRFNYEGNRAVVFKVGAAVDTAALRHCIAMALMYHAGKSD